jgi:lipopolysaccharide/colanic/teichoic acid biosynthesis glycosyltransferase
MLIQPASKIPPAAEPIDRSLQHRLGAVGVAVLAALFASAWTAAAVMLTGGWAYWGVAPERQLHLLICLLSTIAAATYVSRIHGPLDFKLGQAFVGTAVVFGLYALMILAGRLFFSRPMLVSAVLQTLLVALLIVVARHRLSARRVAIIVPPGTEVRASLGIGCVITDPAADLRAFDIVLVSLKEMVSTEWARALSRAMLAGCKVRHVGEYLEELKGAVSVDDFEVDHLPPNGIASYRLVKRAMDVGLVIFFLPVALPLLIVAMVAVLIASGPPVFFVQERVGLGGRRFRMWKLRTMRPQGDNLSVRPAVHGDNRVTPLGRVLRRFRVDEIPQLWNVLKGDMSLIGPRPEAAPLHDEYLDKLPNYAFRYLVRPGITGWAQVNAAPSTNADEALNKLSFDLYYVKKLSVYLDIQIVMRTFWTITAGGGAR